MVALEIFNFLHFLGLAFGLGGATLAFIISIKAEKDLDIRKAQMKLMPAISKLIWIGLGLLIISGVLLPVYIKWPLNKQLLIIKHIFVAWIVIIGIMINSSVANLQYLSPKSRQKPSEHFLKTKRLVKGLSTINLFLWYIVTILSSFV